jgi:outer membrane protein assembly factor BamB
VKRLSLVCLLAIVWCVVLSATVAMPDNWPNWRGPDHTGVSRETALPTVWSEKKNIAWKLPMPGIGGSTPAVWGDRIFLTSSDGNDLVLLCVSTQGKELWKRQVGKVGRKIIKKDEANEASNSPSTDGKHVWAMFGSGDLACFDVGGKEIWKFNIQERYGKYRIQHGIHTTPLLHGDRLYLALLHSGAHWVISLDKATGDEVWKVERKTDATDESLEAYTSPCLWQDAGRKDAYIVVLGCDYTTAHRLSDGGEIWRLGDLNPKSKYQKAFRIIASPIATPELIFVPTARGTVFVAVKPEAKGTVKSGSAFEQWRKAKGSPDVPSPAAHDGLLYVCSEAGRLACWDSKTGKELYNESVHASRYRASPLVADGKVYLTARDGTFSVIKAGPTFTLLASNELNDVFTASPAIANGRIYLRGFKSLYAIQEAGK